MLNNNLSVSSSMVPRGADHLHTAMKSIREGAYASAVTEANKGLELDNISSGVRASLWQQKAIAFSKTRSWEKVAEAAFRGIEASNCHEKNQSLAKLHLAAIEHIKKTPDLYGMSPSICWAAIGKGTQENLDAIAHFVHKKGAKLNSLDRISGETPLMSAAISDESLTTVKYLTGLGADLMKINSFGETALMIASDHGASKVVAYLLNEAGAKLTTYNQKSKRLAALGNTFGQTPLMLAAKGNHLKVTRVILDHVDCTKSYILYKNADGQSAGNMTTDLPILKMILAAAKKLG